MAKRKRRDSALFQMGQIVVTRGVNELVAQDKAFAKHVLAGLSRHRAGEWGDLDPEDRKENDRAVKEGNRILSAYEGEGVPKIWIISEHDRSVTSVLFPDEY